ncbi:MAG: superoxide dismutase [Firmicutes bacterium]|nr:superoxide dismutase [Bacillota bacterium]
MPIGGHVLPPLPYPYDALEPYISATILRLHHDLHHQSYVNGLNQAELRLQEARRSGDLSDAHFWETELAFHGSGHILHSIYWTNMGPGGGGQPGPEAARAMARDFGGGEAFRAQFTAVAAQVRGSGWAIWAWQPAFGRTDILMARQHENVAQWGVIPVLVLDVWEHAYYLEYENRREDYIRAWWDTVRWDWVDWRLREAMAGRAPLQLPPALVGGVAGYEGTVGPGGPEPQAPEPALPPPADWVVASPQQPAEPAPEGGPVGAGPGAVQPSSGEAGASEAPGPESEAARKAPDGAKGVTDRRKESGVKDGAGDARRGHRSGPGRSPGGFGGGAPGLGPGPANPAGPLPTAPARRRFGPPGWPGWGVGRTPDPGRR